MWSGAGRSLEASGTAETDQAETRGGGSLFWFVDDVWLASRGDGGASWPLARGRHTIVCCDADGRAVQASVAVE